MNQIREHWSSRLGFILATLGSAIGLGILWKFPYTVGENGGGLFLFSYFVCVLVVGIPIFIAEMMLGRSSQRAAVGAYEHHDVKEKGWKAIGWFGVLSSFLIMSFYSVIAGWGMSYILMSLSGFYQEAKGSIPETFETLVRSGGVSLFWHFLFTLITVAIVMPGVRKGIEYWAKIMTKTLLVLLLMLVIYSCGLEGFGKAAHFIFAFNPGSFKPSSLIEALGLAFWTLSIGQGIMISYGSYMKRSESIPQMAGVVGSAVVIVAALVGLMIFPAVFTFGLTSQEGPGLIFKTMPLLFAQLPGSLVLSTMFFTLFVFTALTSAIPLIEVVATNLMELIGWTRKKAVILVGCGTFLFGIPSAFAHSGVIFGEWAEIYGMNFLKTIDNLVSIWIIPIGGMLTAYFVGWVMDRKVTLAEFSEGSKLKGLWKPWLFCMRWVIPPVILVIILQKGGVINIDALVSKLTGALS